MGALARPAVLVADDEALLQRLIERILVAAGFPVVVSADGDAAVRCVADGARQPRIEAVVLDVAMPPQGGDVAMDRIAVLRPDIGIVLTSGVALGPAQRAALERHGGVFLPKPFSPGALVQALDEVLRRKGKASGEGA